MVRLAEHKTSTEEKSIKKMPAPKRLYLPLSQHLGRICESKVKASEKVSLGQLIAEAQAQVYSPIHSPVSGEVVSIQNHPHPIHSRCKTIVIDNDAQDSAQEKQPVDTAQISRLTAEDIRNTVFKAGVVGLGGASFPSHIKLNPSKPIETLIINGAECEPYLNADNRLMIERTSEILKGAQLAFRCVGARDIVFAVEENKPEAIEKVKESVKESGLDIKIRVLKTDYPQGGEKQLIKNVLNKEVPSGKLPFDAGVVVHNVATLYAVYEAVYLNKPLYEKVITVSGDCIKDAANLQVRIGTRAKDVIDFCGGLIKEPAKVIFGGPMMGMAQYSLDTPVIKSTSGILLLSEKQILDIPEGLCIRCGKCVEFCPMNLLPCMISLSSRKQRWQMAKDYGCLECIECGLCSYVCPQNINLVHSIKFAKTKVPR